MTTYRTETIGDCTIILGDCREIAPTLAGVDLVLADPPYGIDYKRGPGGKGKAKYHDYDKIIGDAEPFDPAPWLEYPDVILWGGNHFAARLPHGHWLAWDKLAGVPAFDSFSDVEFAWRKGRGKDRIFSHLWKGILKDSEKEFAGRERFHPSQKPVALMTWCLGLAPGAGVVLDPYAGSGTTGVACMGLGRRFIGIEIHEPYFEVACRRIEAAYRQPALFAEPPAPITQGDFEI